MLCAYISISLVNLMENVEDQRLGILQFLGFETHSFKITCFI